MRRHPIAVATVLLLAAVLLAQVPKPGGAGGGGSTPVGPAGGDLAGTYPNPTIKASVVLTTPHIGVATAGPVVSAPPAGVDFFVFDATAATGASAMTIKAGAGQGGVSLLEFLNNADALLTFFDGNGALHSSGGSSLHSLGAAASFAANPTLSISPTATTRSGIIIRGLASQSASLQEWQNNTEAVQASISAAGLFTTQTVNSVSGYRFNGAATTGRFLRADGANYVESSVAAAGAGACTNQFARSLNDNAAPTCATVGTTDIADNAISDIKLRDSAATSVIGRSAGATGDPADIAASVDGQVLRRGSGALGFGAVNLADNTNAVTGTLNVASGGTGAVTIISREQTFCSGTATSSVTLFVTAWNSAACTNTTEGVTQEILANSAGTLRNLRAKAGTAGAAAGSGAITVRINAVNTAVTCTIGTGTTCSDVANSANVAAGDRITVQMVTQATETLANVQIAFEF